MALRNHGALSLSRCSHPGRAGRCALGALIAVALAAIPLGASWGCGPYATYLFVNTAHPDFPLRRYARGALGVPLPSYESQYLALAYRELTRGPFTPQEAQQLNLLAPAPRFPLLRSAQTKQICNGKSSYDCVQILNCTPDAFRQAHETRRMLAARWGADSPQLKLWKLAQVQVFSNCTGGASIPAPLPSSAPLLARQARQYQIAAAYFYAGEFNHAITTWAGILHGPASPWSSIALYLMARGEIRHATLDDKTRTQRNRDLQTAELWLSEVARDPRYRRYHTAAERLMNFVQFRLNPSAQLLILARRLMLPHDPFLRQDAIDFHLLLARFNQPYGPSANFVLPALAGSNDLLDWIYTLRLPPAQAWPRAWGRWRQTHALPWLIAALFDARLGSPHLESLLAAAQRVPAASPGYDAVQLLALRLLFWQGHGRAVQARLANLLQPARLSAMPRSAQNLFLALQFADAYTLPELLHGMSRVPAMLADRSATGDPPMCSHYRGQSCLAPVKPRLETDVRFLLNRWTPVSLLAQMALSPQLPPRLHRKLLLTAWTRAALLQRDGLAAKLAPALVAAEPLLVPSLSAFQSARTPAAHRFAAALTFLRFPGMNPDFGSRTPYFSNVSPPIDKLNVSPGWQVDAANWWGVVGGRCKPAVNSQRPAQPSWPLSFVWPQPHHRAMVWSPLGNYQPIFALLYPRGGPEPPPLLTSTQLAQAQKEWRQLISLPTAQNLLASEVLNWARAHPADPRNPHALWLAAAATGKYMAPCPNQTTPQLQRQALHILKTRYPDSVWTQTRLP